MGSLYLAVRMSAGELGCTYAAMVLFDDEQEITEDKLKTLMSAAKIEFESYWPSLFAKMLAITMLASCSPSQPVVAAVLLLLPQVLLLLVVLPLLPLLLRRRKRRRRTSPLSVVASSVTMVMTIKFTILQPAFVHL